MAKSYTREGLVAALIYVPMLFPFAAVFGIFARDAGLSAFEAFAYSSLVMAGAAQFASLQQYVDHAPVIAAIMTASIINLRMVMYSASISPYFQGTPIWMRAFTAYSLVDQTYVMDLQKFESTKDLSPSDHFYYHFGLAVTLVLSWPIFTMVGYFSGRLFPEDWDIQFAVPISFIALIVPAIKTRPHAVAAVISVVGALTLSFLPYNLGLFISAFVAIIVAAALEKHMSEAS